MTEKKLMVFKYILQNNENFLFEMLYKIILTQSQKYKIILTQSQVLQIVMQYMPKEEIHIFNSNIKKIRYYKLQSICTIYKAPIK